MKILVSALETSSNTHLKALKKELPENVEFVGIFDKELGEPLVDLSSLAIMGFVDAIKRLPFFLNLKSKMVELAKDVDKVLLMDSSGFNLPLAKALKQRYPEKEIIYYILPQAWAWKKGRIKKIEEYCDTLCSILPFEKELYSENTNIHYVGHPLLDQITEFKDSTEKTNKVAFMPGSRKGEISKHIPIFKELRKYIDKKPILIIPPSFTKEHIINTYGDISNFEISTDAHKTLREVDFAFVCSGTATLEASIIGTPFVLSYIAKPLDYFIGRKIVRIPYIGLANIFFTKVGQEPLHKELLQDDVTLQNLLKEYNECDKEEFMRRSKELREYLGSGSSKKVAELILSKKETKIEEEVAI